MRGKLSAAESRYRTKIIQELHYTKDEQQVLDEYVKKADGKYKDIYESGKILHEFFIVKDLTLLCMNMTKFKTSVKKAMKAFDGIPDTVRIYGELE